MDRALKQGRIRHQPVRCTSCKNLIGLKQSNCPVCAVPAPDLPATTTPPTSGSLGRSTSPTSRPKAANPRTKRRGLSGTRSGQSEAKGRMWVRGSLVNVDGGITAKLPPASTGRGLAPGPNCRRTNSDRLRDLKTNANEAFKVPVRPKSPPINTVTALRVALVPRSPGAEARPGKSAKYHFRLLAIHANGDSKEMTRSKNFTLVDRTHPTPEAIQQLERMRRHAASGKYSSVPRLSGESWYSKLFTECA